MMSRRPRPWPGPRRQPAPAAAALAALEAGEVAGYDAAMGLIVPLSRVIFEPPTYHTR